MTEDDERDLALVRASRAGDAAALEQLLRHHYDRVHILCRRITAHDADAQDATQEALIAIVRGLDRFDGVSRFSTWLYRVATNACLDELRRRRRRPEPGLPDETVSAVAAGSPARDPADQAAARVDVDEALAQLPSEFRAAVVLRDLVGLDYAEIADVLGIPPGTVRSRIARGRAALVPLLRGNPLPTDGRPTP